MTNDKFVQFLAVLDKKTSAGVIVWESTIDEDSFRTWIGEGAVRITSSAHYMEEGPSVPYYSAVLINGKGEIADTFTAEEGQKGFRELESLFREARRKSRGADDLLDAMLGHLAEK